MFYLEYKPIDLEKHAGLCTEFAQESHRLTYGSDAVFDEVAGYRAVRFYEKQGWVDMGERPDRPGIHNMRKLL